MPRRPRKPKAPASTTLGSSPKPAVVPDDAAHYINRELGLLQFFRRVLEEAQNPQSPVLERVKFLAIVGSNLAEFFMVRVAGLKQQIEAGIVELSYDGLTPAQQLAAIRQEVLELMRNARACFHELIGELDRAGIHILDFAALNPEQRVAAKAYFDEVAFPVLTPLAYDPGRPFPHISSMSLNLAIVVRQSGGSEQFARLKIPGSLARFVPVPNSRSSPAGEADSRRLSFVWLDQVIANHLGALFPGMEILESHPFRVTRDAEMEIQELEAEDLLESVEQGVRQRRFGSVVRLTIDPAMPPHLRNLLAENLEIQESDIYALPAPLGISHLMQLYEIDRKELKYASFTPAVPPELDEQEDLFAAISRQDMLIHHPFDSFDPVVRFLQTAARDPQVLAIKMTLYRVGRNSPVVEALLEAVGRGKQVAVLVELKARFDEESNIEWARQLDSQGVHVVYGLLGLKTHSKIALVVRREGARIRRYVHLATGNYNVTTAALYTDLGLFTCDEAIGADASDLFNYLTGYSTMTEYRKFLVAPLTLRKGLKALIEREIEHQQNGREAHIILKLNSLVDQPISRLLYRASQAGVRVDLLVRGVCCLKPGVPGLSENIRVVSIVGRFLEHSRIFYFRNGGAETVLLGSADVMVRNLDRRVEILFPIEDPRLIRKLRDTVLGTYLADNVKARVMQPDGSYQRLAPAPGAAAIDSQEWLIEHRARKA